MNGNGPRSFHDPADQQTRTGSATPASERSPAVRLPFGFRQSSYEFLPSLLHFILRSLRRILLSFPIIIPRAHCVGPPTFRRFFRWRTP